MSSTGVVPAHSRLPRELRSPHRPNTADPKQWRSSKIPAKHTLHIQQSSQLDFSGSSQVLNGKHMPKCSAGRGLEITEEVFNQLLYMTLLCFNNLPGTITVYLVNRCLLFFTNEYLLLYIIENYISASYNE